MDLSLTDAEKRFAAEARAWFTAHAETTAGHRRSGRRHRLGPGLAGQAGRRRLGGDQLARRVRRPGGHGRGGGPVQLGVRPQRGGPAGQPGGDQPGRSHAPGPRDPGPVPALAAVDHHGGGDLVPTLQRAGGGFGPERPDHGGRRRRRRVAGHRPEGLDLLRPVRPLGSLSGPQRAGHRAAPGACRSSSSTCRPPGSTSDRSSRSPAKPSSTRSSSTTSSSPTTNWSAGRPGLGRGLHHVGP